MGKENETGLGLGIYPRFTQFRLQCIITLLFFFSLCFGFPAIVAVLVIVGRDMDRGVGEDA